MWEENVYLIKIFFSSIPNEKKINYFNTIKKCYKNDIIALLFVSSYVLIVNPFSPEINSFFS